MIRITSLLLSITLVFVLFLFQTEQSYAKSHHSYHSHHSSISHGNDIDGDSGITGILVYFFLAFIVIVYVAAKFIRRRRH
ncbi:hypothetical protein MK805_09340 [Shimazuella sp. AN120528]|uniref:hypothetical protein n=1 Tax=Shimazuella soli TaxID=1892854 RepID=UPI001F0E635E|nr:hypothetical protein [Shimazuella soli]MCH5585173.1 hypothetical protein [Shimazuella soli]